MFFGRGPPQNTRQGVRERRRREREKIEHFHENLGEKSLKFPKMCQNDALTNVCFLGAVPLKIQDKVHASAEGASEKNLSILPAIFGKITKTASIHARMDTSRSAKVTLSQTCALCAHPLTQFKEDVREHRRHERE